MMNVSKKIFITLLIALIAMNFVGCSDKVTKAQIDGSPDATEFCMYSLYGNNDFALFLKGHNKPWYDENAKPQKTIKVSNRKIHLTYEYSEYGEGDFWDKYLWNENPAVKVYFFYGTNSIAKICAEENVAGTSSQYFLPEFQNMTHKDEFTEYFKSVFELFGYDTSNNELSYKTYYYSVNGANHSGKEKDDFFIPEEKDELVYISLSFKSEYEHIGLWKNCYGRIDYDENRQVKSVTLYFYNIPPQEVFALTDEEVLNVFSDSFGASNKTLETIDGKYVIRYDDGGVLTYLSQKYTIILGKVALQVHFSDSLPNGSGEGLVYYVFPADVTFQ